MYARGQLLVSNANKWLIYVVYLRLQSITDSDFSWFMIYLKNITKYVNPLVGVDNENVRVSNAKTAAS